MLIVTLLVLATASTLFILLRQRHAGWQAWLILALVAIIAWMCAIGAFGLALDSQVASGADGLSTGAIVLVAGFVLYPFILWLISKLFERGRKSGIRDV